MTDASRAFAAGTNTLFIPFSRASITIGSTPFTRRTSPFSESSPMNAASSGTSSIILIARSIAINMARSCTEPLFFISAGARLTITDATGKFIPHDLIAARILSRLSFITVSVRPSISKYGCPRLMSISTSTGKAFSPKSPRLDTLANKVLPPVVTGCRRARPRSPRRARTSRRRGARVPP